MGKNIKITDEVHRKLDNFRGKDETFSMAIDNLLVARLEICALITVIEGMIRYRQFQFEQLQKQSPISTAIGPDSRADPVHVY